MNSRKREYKTSVKIKPTLECDESLEIYKFILDKTSYIQKIIRNTIISIKTNRQREIFSDVDTNISITMLNELYTSTSEILKIQKTLSQKELDVCIDKLQKIIDKISMIICGFGTNNIEDLLYVVFGTEYKTPKFDNKILQQKCELIHNHIHPIGYKIIIWKPGFIKKNIPHNIVCNKLSETIIDFEDAHSYECFDCEKTSKTLYQKINDVRIVIQNEKLKKTLIINGIIDDIQLDCFSNEYIYERIKDIKNVSLNYQPTEKDVINRLLEAMTLKDILIYSTDDIYKKLIGLFIEVNAIKQAKLDVTVKKFLDLDLMSKRSMLINMLIYNRDSSIQYICYLLYDLIAANTTPLDSDEKSVYESLPWKLKNYFNDIVKYTAKNTNEINQKYEINKITLEQQIHMMKSSETVKEKAMTKLKEIKGRPDEISAKAKQYLEGLVKIPFGIYKEEKILKLIKENNKWFIRLLDMVIYFFPDLPITKKEKFTNIEISKIIKNVMEYINANINEFIKKTCERNSAKQVSSAVQSINYIIKQRKQTKIQVTNQTKNDHISNIVKYLKSNNKDIELLLSVYDKIHYENNISLCKTIMDINTVKTNMSLIEKTVKSISDVLEESIYSHNHAKNQIMKIIGQWMNGEQTGYCFGFEGSPGIGKTSLAKKGLSKCLIDENGEARPFHFIALGGSSCGANIEGHGYTYANSTWGKLIDILMEAKCMNPIIYVDELDKVSNTENGKEIINIFMHLIDQTQNNTFQDKYFSGIDIDLSKVLFIFSYNDPEQIDRILLDRIHRIKFENLTLEDKMVIVKKYIIPEINKKMGFENLVEITDELLKYIIESYTIEPGVRKLKEVLFDLYGEINLDILKCKDEDSFEIPVIISKTLLETKYLVKYQKVKENKIHDSPETGVINGLWANSLGFGGIIPIQTLFFPSSSFLELKLTGLQGDVMKESMNVAKTLAWNLTDDTIKKKWIKTFDETKCQGLHIHCPEGSVSKDGPSAGAAITTAIYSLLNNKLIKNDIAITGEISLNGEITEIGGLDVKISGGIRAGIKTFLYPKSNANDFNEWKKKSENNIIISDINFIEITNIKDVFNVLFS
jgi:ATP-dependent Lon protease